MAKALDADFVAKYARPPSKTTLDQAISLHSNVRTTLGDAEYLTFLQGSYKNDTAIADMNDVDVVALCRAPAKTFWDNPDWQVLFAAIERKLQANPNYQGKWKRGDKCITLHTSVKIDIVPAVATKAVDDDPIDIHSFSSSSSRKNWPRLHYVNAAKKSGTTNGAFKQSVRLFKRWARCHFAKEKVAPSYYLECLLHSLPNPLFTADLAAGFVALGRDICTRYGGGFSASYVLPRIGGQGDLFSCSEWDITRFRRFRTTLESSIEEVQRAVTEVDPSRAKAAWRRAFAGFDA